MRRILPVLLLLLAVGHAQAQSTTEDRLRDAVKKLTGDLRATQDALAPLQAQLDAMTKQRDALQTQLDAAKAQLAQVPATPVVDEEQVKKLQAELEAAHKDNAALQAALAK